MKKAALFMLSMVLLAGCAQNEVTSPVKENNPKSQVINGTPSEKGARPYQVAVFINDRQSCGGTILSKDWVMTAAHCLGHGRLTIRAGSLNASSGGKVIAVTEEIKHPEFSNVMKGYDIAVLKLAEPLKFDENIQPAALPTQAVADQYTKEGSVIVLSGWGMTIGGKKKSNSEKLLEASLPVLNSKDCRKQLGMRPVTDGMICGNKNSRNQTSCHGDSGGPFAAKIQGQHFVFGVVSWGADIICNKATVFSRVSKYQSWLTEATGIQPKDVGSNPNPNPKPNPGDGCDGLKTFKGNLPKEGYSKFHSSSKGFECSGNMKGVLKGKSKSDFDLYLQKKEGMRWVDVGMSTEEGTNETITYNAAKGVYRWEVYSYEGNGDYTLVGSRD